MAEAKQDDTAPTAILEDPPTKQQPPKSSVHQQSPSALFSPPKPNTTSKPSPITFPSLIPLPARRSMQSSAGSVTIKPLASLRSNDDSITLKPTSYVRHLIEYNRILADLDRRSCSASLDLKTVVPGKRLTEMVIDEVDVESCVLCTKERSRERMELKEVEGVEQGAGDKGFVGKGLWWVCKAGCDN